MPLPPPPSRNASPCSLGLRLLSTHHTSTPPLLPVSLRDYRAHFTFDVEEMAAVALLWRQCLLALGLDAEHIQVQAQALMEASISRHMRRLRLSLSAQLSGNERLAELGTRLAAEVETEAHFSACFGSCMPLQPPELAGNATPAVDRQATAALRCSLGVLSRELACDLQPALHLSQTIDAHSMAALSTLVPLVRQLRRQCGAELLPELDGLANRMASGWCDQLGQAACIAAEDSLPQIRASRTAHPPESRELRAKHHPPTRSFRGPTA